MSYHSILQALSTVPILRSSLCPITINDEVFFANKYSLVTTINYLGNLARDHYWDFIKNAPSKQ